MNIEIWNKAARSLISGTNNSNFHCSAMITDEFSGVPGDGHGGPGLVG
jgi:hypothetical protein